MRSAPLNAANFVVYTKHLVNEWESEFSRVTRVATFQKTCSLVDLRLNHWNRPLSRSSPVYGALSRARAA